MFKVLSIDGGGIRGVIPAYILQNIENRSGKRTAEIFDLIVGTSTGGILAAGLTVPDDSGTDPKYSAEDLLQLYTEYGSDIFRRSFWKGVTSPCGAADEQYDAEPLERVLEQYLGNTTLADCLIPIAVASYDVERRQPYFFKTSRALESSSRNHYLKEAARATSAAPTYFEPAVVKSRARRSVTRSLIDGGVFVNNPAMTALVEALSLGHELSDILVVSLGTGISTREIPFEDAKDWDAPNWVRPVISIMMDGSADAADYQVKQLLPYEGDAQRYFRFDGELEVALDDLDAANEANILALMAEAEQILHAQSAEVEKLLALFQNM